MNSLTAANLACLEQGITFLKKLLDPGYTRPCPEVFSSTVGGHMRHNLDHYRAFLSGWADGEIDYDDRVRETAIETSRDAAITLMRDLANQLEFLGSADLDRPLWIRMDDGGDSTWSATSLRRELQFLLSHTIHHYALIVSIASRFGFTEFPEGFGVAPSTLHYRAGAGKGT